VQIFQGGQKLTPPVVVANGLRGPEGMAVAPDGTLLVVESQAGRLSRINLRSGAVSSVAKKLELGFPGTAHIPSWILDGVAVGPSGAIYVGGDKANVVYRIQ
jgi:glucose/arabinose dehydrogenase